MSQLILQPFIASLTSQFILQPFFRFSYVTSSLLNSPGELPMNSNESIVVFTIDIISIDYIVKSRLLTKAGK